MTCRQVLLSLFAVSLLLRGCDGLTHMKKLNRRIFLGCPGLFAATFAARSAKAELCPPIPPNDGGGDCSSDNVDFLAELRAANVPAAAPPRPATSSEMSDLEKALKDSASRPSVEPRAHGR